MLPGKYIFIYLQDDNSSELVAVEKKAVLHSPLTILIGADDWQQIS